MDPAAIGRRWYIWLPGLFVSLGLTIPLAYLIVRATGADPQTLWSLVVRPRTAVLIGNTVLLGATVVLATTLVAVPLAWLSVRARTRTPWLFTALGILPLAVPGYVTAYILLSTTGSYGAFAQLTGLSLPRAGGFVGAAWALSAYTYPYLFLNLRTALLTADPSLEESARALGLGRRAVFRRVLLPQLRTGYLSGALLVLLHVIGDFGVVSLMRFETLSYALFLQYSAAFDRTYAAWIALILLGLAMIFIVGERRLLGRTIRLGGASVRPGLQVALGRFALPAYLLCALLTLQAVILPIGTLLYWMGGAGSTSWLDLATSLAHSVQASFPAAVLASLLAIPIAWAAMYHPGRLGRIPDQMAWFGYAMPPLAFALGLLVFSLSAAPWLYQTIVLLILAYALHFLAEATGPVRSVLERTSPRMLEAAQSLGHTPAKAFRRVLLPILRPGLLASMAFVFLSAMKELPITFLLSPAGFDTLALAVWSYTNEAVYALAAPYALAVILFAGCFVGLLVARRTSTGG